MPVVGAEIYCPFCSSEALWKGSFPLHHLEGPTKLRVVRAWLVVLTSPGFHALFKTCTHNSLPPACPGGTEFGTLLPWEQS